MASTVFILFLYAYIPSGSNSTGGPAFQEFDDRASCEYALDGIQKTMGAIYGRSIGTCLPKDIKNRALIERKP